LKKVRVERVKRKNQRKLGRVREGGDRDRPGTRKEGKQAKVRGARGTHEWKKQSEN
jgi:hypothetical protein